MRGSTPDSNIESTNPSCRGPLQCRLFLRAPSLKGPLQCRLLWRALWWLSVILVPHLTTLSSLGFELHLHYEGGEAAISGHLFLLHRIIRPLGCLGRPFIYASNEATTPRDPLVALEAFQVHYYLPCQLASLKGTPCSLASDPATLISGE